MGVDGPGPDYCKHCMAARRTHEKCDGCDEPAILPENMAAAELYIATRTQWRRGDKGQLRGMDYAGVLAAMQLRGVKKRKRAALFEQLQALEQATVEAQQELLERHDDSD